MSLFDLQDVCIAIGSIATLDLPMVVDLIGIYGLKGPYCTLTTTDWFLQALSVIPRGSWGDVARRSTMIRWAAAAAASTRRRRRRLRRKIVSGQFDEENPFVLISSALIVQPDEGVSDLVVDRIGDNLPQSTEKSRILVIPVGARHKCQQDARLPHLCAYKYQRTTTEFLTPFRNSQSERQHFFATKCCGNSSRFLAKIRAIDLLPDFVQIAGFVLPDFTPDSYTRLYQISDFEFCVVMSSVHTDFYCRYMGLRNISDSGLLGKEERYKRNEETDERAVERSKDREMTRGVMIDTRRGAIQEKMRKLMKEQLRDPRTDPRTGEMRSRSDKRPSHKHDRKVLMAEESTKSWADTDSESSSSSTSSSDSEQEEVHCLMADQTSDDEVFDFSNIEFTREDLFQALNDMVHEYKTLSHTFEEIKAENASLKNSSAESSSDKLEDTDSLKTELSKLRIENELLRSESSELKAEVEKLTKEMSSWTQSARAFHKLQEIQKSAHDRTGLGFSNSKAVKERQVLSHNLCMTSSTK
ncbi:hypothetical protein F511_18066 [Dorcoceras hygrometricum]|uniref:Uncharacterized protein n=1 Tax=Dorcoceras hygrometricum TaxID=472368 RepID=A0A2Z7CBF4_9LAMI|nr:hypothetical protein F511_18066 [Dorcoceras hygrometricum]